VKEREREREREREKERGEAIEKSENTGFPPFWSARNVASCTCACQDGERKKAL